MLDNNIYQKVYFRIESGYVWGQGMPESLKELFRQSIRTFLTKHGFEIDEPEDKMRCIEGKRGFESLYCHPQSLSGFIAKDKIDELEADLQNSGYTGFKYLRSDRYEDMKNYTPEELESELEAIDGEIEGNMLDMYRTKRKNLFRSTTQIYDYANELAKKLQTTLEADVKKYVGEKFLRLVRDGKLIEAETRIGKAYRTNIIK